MRTRTPQIAAALLAGASLAAPAGPAQAASSDSAVSTIGKTALPVTGHGYGHGHGMSQYGAQGAARQGLTHSAILAFYYPGTKLSTMSGKIRVLITGDTDNNTIVRPTTGLKVTDLRSGKSYVLPTDRHPSAWKLRVVDGATRVYYRTDTWHRYRPGGHGALAGDGQFKSPSGRLTLKLASGDRVYRGKLRLVNKDTVNVLGIDKYLKGVVASEMPPSWKPAALRAQAVAARTYADRSLVDNASRYYHICDTTSCQVYKGYGAETASTNAAVDATAGQILTYVGKPAFTQFSASSGGWTSKGGQPYLPAKQDIYDKPVDPETNTGDPHYSWKQSISVATLQKAYGSGTLQSIRILTRENTGADWGGWVLGLELNGTHGPKALAASTFRSMFGLKSTYFTLTP